MGLGRGKGGAGHGGQPGHRAGHCARIGAAVAPRASPSPRGSRRTSRPPPRSWSTSGVDPDRLLALAARARTRRSPPMRLWLRLSSAFGSCDILVNNAGTNPSAGPLMEVDLGALDKTWAVNLRAPLLWVQAAYRALDGGEGRFGGQRGLGRRPAGRARSLAPTTSRRQGLVHMTRQLASRARPEDQGQCGCACGRQDPACQRCCGPMSRQRPGCTLWEGWAQPEDIARAIVFLASDAATG